MVLLIFMQQKWGFLLFSALHLSSQGIAIFTGGGGGGVLCNI